MVAHSVVRLAAAAYPLETLPDWAALCAKLDRWVAQAVEGGAQIAVFPEYAAMEAALIGGAIPADWYGAAADVAEAYRDHLAGLARAHDLVILTGSGPAREGAGLFNRAWLCTPDGAMHPVDKQILTPWERNNTPMSAGEGMRVFDTRWGRLGVLICYDSEFPLLARALDPDILLIPSCTDTTAGQSRVRLAAQARALERQCVTLHAPLLGQVPQCPLIDTNTGQAGLYVTPDRDLPQDGVLVQGAQDSAGWVFGDAPLALLAQRRDDGDVSLRADWRDADAPVATLLTLSC